MKRFNKIYIFLIAGIVLLLAQNSYSQISLSKEKSKQDEQQFIARIKQFNEFIDRFNYKTDFNGDQIDSVFSDQYPREKYLSHLFNMEITEDSGLNPELISEFISNICDKATSIYKYSPNIIALAKTRILYHGRSESINVFLNQEIVGDDMVKWVVLDVYGEVLNFMQEDTSHIRFISPSSNETNFINLKRAMQDSVHLQNYAHINFRYDPLSVFFYCLNKNIIKIEHVENLSYYINDIPGWCFKVEEYNRPSYNSGWLISDLYKCDLDLHEFLDYIILSF